MSDFAVIAQLPLGTYRARTPGEALDAVPSPARLHAALVCAAAAGPRAREDGDVLAPDDEDANVLRWLEEHPPDGVSLPRTRVQTTTALAYRREGTLVKEGSDKGPKDKVVARPLVGLVAVDGPFAWTWREPPPASVQDGLAALCHDVSHLGTAETPARLHVGTATPTHRRLPGADLSSPPGLDVEVAAPGRTAALEAAHRLTQSRPAAGLDSYATSERVHAAAYVAEGRQPARYLGLAPLEPEAPWRHVLLATFGHAGMGQRDQDRVMWAVAVHRALVALAGDEAPPVLTGAYASDVPRPANRVAIQFLDVDAATLVGLPGLGSVLAVLLPEGVAPDELALVSDAFARLRSVRSGRGVRQVGQLGTRSARTFWPVPVEAGRLWRTSPVAVPDTRPLRGSWTLYDAIALSVGLVLRDRPEFAVSEQGQARYRALAARATTAGLVVVGAQRLAGGDLTRYVHRTDPTRVVQPYRATLRLQGVMNERALVAIGQSRHLGGGLLVPDDGAPAES